MKRLFIAAKIDGNLNKRLEIKNQNACPTSQSLAGGQNDNVKFKKNKKRIFIAMKLPANLQEKVLEFKKKYSDLDVRWVTGRNLHITLIPPWNESDIEKIIDKLKAFKAKTKTIMLNFNKICLGPKKERPNLIWAEGEAPKELLDLVDDLEKLLDKFSNRKFKLHLTLARFKYFQWKNFPDKNFSEIVDWKAKLKQIELIESNLLPDGAKYKTLYKIAIS